MIEIYEFKGNKVIKLMRQKDDKYPVSFGVGKAKLVLEHISDIEQFVKENDRPRGR